MPDIFGSLISRTFEPGWSWEMCVKPIVKTNSCQAHHTSYIISGRMKVVMGDGAGVEGGPWRHSYNTSWS
jgi:hypothetical protein